jgi:hypothetical protein
VLHRPIRVRILNQTGRSPISGEAKTASVRPTLEAPPGYMSDRFYYLQLKFTPKIGHTFTDEREVVVEVPKDLVQRKSESINESLREVIAVGLARSAALGSFPTESERTPEVYDEAPPNWYSERHQIMNERACDHEENGIRAWRILETGTSRNAKPTADLTGQKIAVKLQSRAGHLKGNGATTSKKPSK